MIKVYRCYENIHQTNMGYTTISTLEESINNFIYDNPNVEIIDIKFDNIVIGCTDVSGNGKQFAFDTQSVALIIYKEKEEK